MSNTVTINGVAQSDVTVTITTGNTPPPGGGEPPPGGGGQPPPGGGNVPPGVVLMTFDWSNPVMLYTSSAGGMHVGQVFAFAFTPTSSGGIPNMPLISGVEYQGPGVKRIWSLSTIAGDMSMPFGEGPGGNKDSLGVTMPFATGTGDNAGYYPKLELGKTYYVNVVTPSGESYPTTEFNMRFGLSKNSAP